jgi:modulator of FtsH protease HflC
MRTSLIIVVLAVLLLAASCAFVVDQTEFAVVTHFGDPSRVLATPGLYFKYPWPIDRVMRLDNRLQVLENPAPGEADREYLTSHAEAPVRTANATSHPVRAADAAGPSGQLAAAQESRIGKNVVVTTYTCWRIKPDPASILRFLETMRDNASAGARLGDVVVSELGAALGSIDFAELVSTQRDPAGWTRLMEGIRQRCRTRVEQPYGIDVVDVRIQRLNFPEQNRRNVFERMRAERETIAARYRAEGEEQATRIKASAARQRDEILAQANMEAEQMRGRADADAARIYAQAYGQDAEFYGFLRTLESYEKAFNENTVAILSGGSEFLRLLNQPAPGSAGILPAPARPNQPGTPTTQPSENK